MRALPSASSQRSPSTLHSAHGAANPTASLSFTRDDPRLLPRSSPSLNEESTAASSPLVPVHLYCRPTLFLIPDAL